MEEKEREYKHRKEEMSRKDFKEERRIKDKNKGERRIKRRSEIRAERLRRRDEDERRRTLDLVAYGQQKVEERTERRKLLLKVSGAQCGSRENSCSH